MTNCSWEVEIGLIKLDASNHAHSTCMHSNIFAARHTTITGYHQTTRIFLWSSCETYYVQVNNNNWMFLIENFPTRRIIVLLYKWQSNIIHRSIILIQTLKFCSGVCNSSDSSTDGWDWWREIHHPKTTVNCFLIFFLMVLIEYLIHYTS